MKSNADNFQLERIQEAFKEIRVTLPKIIANDALNFTNDNFKKQGFDLGAEPWKPRKGKPRTKRDATRAILVKSGRLRRATFIKLATWDNITIANSTPYAAIHNNGGRIDIDYNRKIISFGKNGKFISQKAHEKVGKGVYSIKTRKESYSKRSLVSHQQQVTINAHSINMPQRQFMGHSKTLQDLQLKKINNVVLAMFKNK